MNSYRLTFYARAWKFDWAFGMKMKRDLVNHNNGPGRKQMPEIKNNHVKNSRIASFEAPGSRENVFMAV